MKINNYRKEEMASDFVLRLKVLKSTKVFVKKKKFRWVEFGLKIWGLGPILRAISPTKQPIDGKLITFCYGMLGLFGLSLHAAIMSC